MSSSKITIVNSADSMMSGMTDNLFVDVLSIRVNPDACVFIIFSKHKQ